MPTVTRPLTERERAELASELRQMEAQLAGARELFRERCGKGSKPAIRASRVLWQLRKLLEVAGPADQRPGPKEVRSCP